MLAPLKDRSILERNNEHLAADEIHALRHSLRQARQMHKRSATQAARKIIALTNQLARGEEENRQLRARLEALDSGQAIVSMGQALMRLQAENDALRHASQRLWFLDRTLCAAHRECERLAGERNSALAHLRSTSKTTI